MEVDESQPVENQSPNVKKTSPKRKEKDGIGGVIKSKFKRLVVLA